jgi:phosphatidate cytidylyltransferase
MSGDAATTPAGALSRRLISGIVLHVAAVGILLAPAWFWLPLTLAGSWRLNHELAALLPVGDPQRLRRQSALFGAGIITVTALDAGMAFGSGAAAGLSSVVLGAALVGAFCLKLAERPRAATADVALLWFAILYAGWLPSFLPLLRLLENGQWLIAWVVGGVVLSDNAGLLFGRLFGRRPFFAHLSPGKTRAGAVGSLLVTTAVLTLCGPLAGIPTVHALVLGLLIAVCAQAGDLAASLVKRDAGVKDAATLIPGHGGLLDRLDSLMFAGLVSYGYLTRVLP